MSRANMPEFEYLNCWDLSQRRMGHRPCDPDNDDGGQWDNIIAAAEESHEQSETLEYYE